MDSCIQEFFTKRLSFFLQTNYQTVEAILKAIEDDLEIVHDGMEFLELFKNWLDKQSKVLSENHYLQLNMKKRLLDIYRVTPPPPEENLEEFRDFMEKQVNLGQNLLAIWSILEPGYRFSNLNGSKILISKMSVQNQITVEDVNENDLN